MEIVYSINYQPNDVPKKNQDDIALHMHVALVAGLFIEMKPNKLSRDEKLSRPFDSFILDKSRKTVLVKKQNFIPQMQKCFPKMKMPRRGTDGKAWYISLK